MSAVAPIKTPVMLARPPRAGMAWRWLVIPPLALLVVLLLIILMRWMILAPEASLPGPEAPEETATLVKLDTPPPPEAETEASLPKLPSESSSAPPSSPPSLARPALPAIAVPSIAVAAPSVDVSNIASALPTASNVGTASSGTAVGTGKGSGSGLGTGSGLGGTGLGGSGVFGGFAGGGQGNFARGESFKGKVLIPLSTARPQMPDWACKKKIKGWVEVVFIVNTTGRVENVRIIDAQPRGVFEAAAIENVGNWIYEKMKAPAEVKQRVDMNPEDCDFNYGQ